MATTPTMQDNPQAGAPTPAAQQANPLQESLAKLAMACRTLGSQNTIIQEDMQAASALFVKALQKVSQAGSAPPQAASAPPQA